MGTIKPGIYRHYKGNLYEVIGVGRHSETLAEVVIYKALYKANFGKNSLWVRPRRMFVERSKIDGKYVKRFKYAGKNLRNKLYAKPDWDNR